MRILVLFFISSPFWLLPNIANAGCTATSGITFDIFVDTIYLDLMQSSGNKIGPEYSATMGTIAKCSNMSSTDNLVISINAAGKQVSLPNGNPDGRFVYETSITGVGFSIGASGRGCSKEGWVASGSGVQNNLFCTLYGKNIPSEIKVAPKIQLYSLGKTISTTQSHSSTKKIGYTYALVNKSQKLTEFPIYVSISPMRASCRVTTPTVNVNMGSFKTTMFQGILTGPSTTSDFSIGLSCSNTPTPISLQIDGDIVAGNLQALSLNKTSDVATGVGIQILKSDGSVFKLASPQSMGTQQGTNVVLPLKARYVQVANTVTAGKANASATFTIVYQ
ncbi:fimbrial protein [Orbus wheelerorum]|uniref:fimbrial protein n=1 Tax=Orbus wheelerorum TaxID=3074111 RepID=UPI00370D70C6